MAENKKGFVLYADQKFIFDDLNNEEAGILIKHIFSYVNDENPTTDNRIVQIAFNPIKMQLKRDLVKYESVRERNSLNARKRWDAVASSGIPNDTKNADKDKVIDKDKVKDKDINISFDVFWDLYNKKVGSKDSCLSKWNKLKDDERQKIIDTLPTFLKSISDKKFQPHAQTYLNQSRWNDEIVVTEQNEITFKCEDMNAFGFFYPLLTQNQFDERIKTNPNLKKL